MPTNAVVGDLTIFVEMPSSNLNDILSRNCRFGGCQSKSQQSARKTVTFVLIDNLPKCHFIDEIIGKHH